ncbi:helix-turn-helix domain-containing protein [Streptomyces sp. NPDC060005]|uniref:helix-turn-helix domain-containing protein n=1 Tax=Streptomyces sp. NPDC060005 TaxID=3347034 RepID=UPI0036AC9FD7
MRGLGDHLSIGERIAFYRKRRGYTQEVLAGLVGRSTDWLAKIETSRRKPPRIDMLAELSRILRVPLGGLLGQTVLMEDERQQDDVPAVRDALMSPRRLSRLLFGPEAEVQLPTPAPVAVRVEQAWNDYQGGRLGTVIAALPALLQTAQELEERAARRGDDRSDCWAVSARTHHLAATTLEKIGESDISWLAAERAMRAADESDDPLVLASAARSGTHALLANGRYDDALELGNTAAAWLSSRVTENDPAACSLLGMIHLRAAVAAAANGVVWRSNFNAQEWKRALAAAGLIAEVEKGGRYESAREHGMHALRHFYASVLLDAGESIKAVSQYLGHSDPGLTLRVYAHLMPESQARACRAVDAAMRYGKEVLRE